MPQPSGERTEMTDPRTDKSDNEAADETTVTALAQADAGEADDHDDDDFDDEGEQRLPLSLQGPYTSEHFHIVTHKLIKHAINELISDNKFDWEVIAPFLESAREMAQADFDEAQFRLHTVRAEGDQWVEAEEAYLGVSIADRDSGEEWLSETFWLSELAIAEDDPEQVRRIIAGLERSIGKMREWIAEKEAGGAAEATPPAGDTSP